MKTKNKVNKINTIKKNTNSKKTNNFIVRMMTGKSYDEFITEETKGMFIFEKKEFIKNLNIVLNQISKTIAKEVFANAR